jgi:predicted Zn-dependent protease
MLAEAKAREVAQAVLEAAKKAGAEEAEVHLSGGRSALTRFAVNEVHQNVEATVLDVALRVALGKRTARTSTTRTDAAGLADLARRTVEIARIAPEDPELLPVLSPSEAGDAPSATAIDAETDALSPEKRAALAKHAIDEASKAGFEAAGYVASSRTERTFAYMNSKGLFRFFDRTGASFGITVEGKDSSGWAEAGAPRIGAIAVDELVARALQKAKASANPGEVEPGAWDVVLEPAAVGGLTEFLGWSGFNGRSYSEGDAWSAGQLGKKVFGENITMRDDFADPRNPGAGWDGEGERRSKLVLVDKGVLSALAWDRRSAKKFGATSTGHAGRAPSLYGGNPENVIFDGGTATLDQMIASTKRGILVTHFWYIRLVDPKRVVVTGMTRDGTFLIEDGKVVRGIKNLRFNESVVEMLGRVETMGPTDPTYLVPAMKVRGFTFSSKTKF